MTPSALDTYVAKMHGGSYLRAAQMEADIADQWEGSGDPDCDAMALTHRRISLDLLARAVSLSQRPNAHP